MGQTGFNRTEDGVAARTVPAPCQPLPYVEIFRLQVKSLISKQPMPRPLIKVVCLLQIYQFVFSVLEYNARIRRYSYLVARRRPGPSLLGANELVAPAAPAAPTAPTAPMALTAGGSGTPEMKAVSGHVF